MQSAKISDHAEGMLPGDNGYIYNLPFKKNKMVFLIQGYKSFFSHKGDIALDFKIKQGTKIYAARAGVVEAVRTDRTKGGLKWANVADDNYVMIRHDDSTLAVYRHFMKNGVLVNVGDVVAVGTPIGLCGSTGYSAFPHLHFEVFAQDDKEAYHQIPTKFYTAEGPKYLVPGHYYKVVR